MVACLIDLLCVRVRACASGAFVCCRACGRVLSLLCACVPCASSTDSTGLHPILHGCEAELRLASAWPDRMAALARPSESLKERIARLSRVNRVLERQPTNHADRSSMAARRKMAVLVEAALHDLGEQPLHRALSMNRLPGSASHDVSTPASPHVSSPKFRACACAPPWTWRLNSYRISVLSRPSMACFQSDQRDGGRFFGSESSPGSGSGCTRLAPGTTEGR